MRSLKFKSTEDRLVCAEDIEQAIVYLRLNSPARPTRLCILIQKN